MKQSASWIRVLLRALPQRVEWHISQDQDGLRVTSDFRLFAWYGLVLYGLLLFSLISVGGFPWIEQWLGPGPAWMHMVAFGALGLGLMSLLLCAWLLDALGGRGTTVIRHEIISTLESSGATLEPVGVEISRRHGLSMLGLAGFACLVAALFFFADYQVSPPSFSLPQTATLLAVLALASFLLASGMAFLRVRGFASRATAIASGLATMIALLILVAAPLMWSISGLQESALAEIRNGWPEEPVLSASLGDLEPGTTMQHSRLSKLRDIAWIVVCCSLLVPLLGLGLLAYAIRTSIHLLRDLKRLKTNPASRLHRRAIGDKRLIQLFRVFFLGSWGLSTCILFVGYLFAALCLLQALFPFMPYPTARPAESSALMVGLMVGLTPDGVVLTLLARGGWILYCWLVLAAPAASIGHLAIVRRTNRRRLRRLAAATAASKQGQEIRRLLDAHCDLWRAAGLRIAISKGSRLEVRSHRFGVLHQERYVEISKWLFDRLEPDEREALLGHELAHHLSGDCLFDNLCRWLARISLTGDGFARAVQDSFGREQRADETAVARLGASPDALARCLKRLGHTDWFLRNVAPQINPASSSLHSWLRHRVHELIGDTEDSGDLAATTPKKKAKRVSLASWHLFLHQFLYGMEHHYWHPDYQDRLANLERWIRRNQLGEGERKAETVAGDA